MGFCIIWINLNHFPIPFDRFLCIIDLFESNAKVEVRIYIIGVNFNGCAISFDCFFKFPHIKKRNSKIVVSTTVDWVNSDGCAEALRNLYKKCDSYNIYLDNILKNMAELQLFIYYLFIN